MFSRYILSNNPIFYANLLKKLYEENAYIIFCLSDEFPSILGKNNISFRL